MHIQLKDGTLLDAFAEDDETRKKQKANAVSIDFGAGNPKISRIHRGDFAGLENLEVCTGESVKQIEDEVFKNCKNLREVQFPNIEFIGYAAFEGCTSLEVVDIREYGKRRAEMIPARAFAGCSSLKQISEKIPINAIGDYAFAGCTSLEFAGFDRVGSIGKWAFQRCSSLRAIDFPTAKEVKVLAFDDCASLVKANLPIVFRIGAGAFRYCRSLTEVVIPEVDVLRDLAFAGCTSLPAISAPKAREVGSRAFKGCTSLETVEFTNAWAILSNVFEGCTSLTSVEFPRVTTIYPGTFSHLDNASFPILETLEHLSFRSTEATLRVLYLKNLKYLALTEFGNDDFGEREWPTTFPVLANLPDSFNPSPEEIQAFTGFTRKLPIVFMYASGRVVAHNKPTVSQRRTIAALSMGPDPEGYKKFSKEAVLALKKGVSNGTDRIGLPREAVSTVLEYIKPSFGVPTVRNLRRMGINFVKKPPPVPIGPTKRKKNNDHRKRQLMPK